MTHYDTISALHKSLRGSDPDAALYWLARMLEAGEDPLFIARRLVRFASEDVGLADPQALVAGDGGAAGGALHRACRRARSRWPRLVVYLALAPKSNARLPRLRRGAARCRERRATIRCRCTCATRRPG